MYIEGISSFRTQTMDFQLDVIFQQYWKDDRLAHNESKRILIRDQEILKKMWRPDTYFANARIAEFHDVTQPNFLLWIEKDGSILYDTRISMVVICAMRLHNYPMDSQWCNLRMLSYAYDVNDLIIEWNEVDAITKNANITLPDMQIARLEPGVLRRRVRDGRLELRDGRIISWFSFWLGLDVEAVPARVSLAITTLLTLSTQANSVRTTLPEVSYMRSIDVFLTVSVLFVFGVMIEFVTTNFLQRRARMAAQEANNKGAEEPKNETKSEKRLKSRMRNVFNRMFRTGTELRNLIEHHELNGDGPPSGVQEIPLRQQGGRPKSAFWPHTATPPSLGRRRLFDQLPQSVITAQPPPIYETHWPGREAERLANWTRPEMSCDELAENTAAPATTATPLLPPSYAVRSLAQRLRSAQPMEDVPLGNGAEPPSPRSQGSGSKKFVNLVRQLQHNKKEYGKARARKIDEWSRYLFPISYFIFHLFYW
ncbi:CBN-GGR-2 protein [Aphelenchoides fujianensis]|nr:CBN-GGR-2 protein [Aphelenchoides fujianensis]